MIKVKVRSIWQGKVGIRDKYLVEAKKYKDDIAIYKGNDLMIIPFDKLDEAVIAKSENPFQDRYSKESHYLIYFSWSPTTIQSKLF